MSAVEYLITIATEWLCSLYEKYINSMSCVTNEELQLHIGIEMYYQQLYK